MVDHPVDVLSMKLKECSDSGNDVEIESGTVLKGDIFFGKNVRVGAHCFLRGPLFIGDNVKIGSYNEIARSVILDGSMTSHQNCILDSYIGRNCWIGGSTCTSNLKLDRQDVKVYDSEGNVKYCPKYGVTMEDDCKVGGWVSIMAGAYLTKESVVYGPSVLYGRGKVKYLWLNKEN
jgi:NDP-sugar pyrophosphorylase family protein